MRRGAHAKRAVARRAMLAGLVSWPLWWAGPSGAQEAATSSPILVVSRSRVLNETAAAQVLRAAEADYSGRLQAKIDELKAAFDAEEQELTALRATMERTAFETRIADFDRRVRAVRRLAQERAGELQKLFQDARLELVNALTPLLDQVRRERGALVLLNADDALANDPAIDITEEVIVLFDEMVSTPDVPPFDPFALPDAAE